MRNGRWCGYGDGDADWLHDEVLEPGGDMMQLAALMGEVAKMALLLTLIEESGDDPLRLVYLAEALSDASEGSGAGDGFSDSDDLPISALHPVWMSGIVASGRVRGTIPDRTWLTSANAVCE